MDAMKRYGRIRAAAFAALSAAGCLAASAQTIRLQAKAVVSGGSVQLGNIATVQNTDAATAQAWRRR